MGQLLSATPESRNVSVGTLVEITCASSETGLDYFNLTTEPQVDGSNITDTQPNGGTQHTLSFIAPAQNSIIVSCIVVKGSVVDQSIAVLMIQGEPVSKCRNKVTIFNF